MSKIDVAPPCGNKVGARWVALPGAASKKTEFECIHCGRIADSPERLCNGETK